MGVATQVLVDVQQNYPKKSIFVCNVWIFLKYRVIEMQFSTFW